MSPAIHQLVCSTVAWLALSGVSGCYRHVGVKAEWREERVLDKLVDPTRLPSAEWEGQGLVVGRVHSCRAKVSTEMQTVQVAQLKRGDGDVVLGTLGTIGAGLILGGAAWAIINERDDSSPLPGLALGGGGLALVTPAAIVAGVLSGKPIHIERRVEMPATQGERFDGLPEPCGEAFREAGPYDLVFSVTYEAHPDAVTWSGRTTVDGEYREPSLDFVRGAVSECGAGQLAVFLKQDKGPSLLRVFDVEPSSETAPSGDAAVGARPEMLSLRAECCGRKRAILHEESCLEACGAAMDALPCVRGFARCVESVTSEVDAALDGGGAFHCSELRDKCLSERSRSWASLADCATQCSALKGRAECKHLAG